MTHDPTQDGVGAFLAGGGRPGCWQQECCSVDTGEGNLREDAGVKLGVIIMVCIIYFYSINLFVNPSVHLTWPPPPGGTVQRAIQRPPQTR
eukprot:COSAG01_NODE_44258_length_420_cov_41.498442_1_plen_91_part_00